MLSQALRTENADVLMYGVSFKHIYRSRTKQLTTLLSVCGSKEIIIVFYTSLNTHTHQQILLVEILPI